MLFMTQRSICEAFVACEIYHNLIGGIKYSGEQVALACRQRCKSAEEGRVKFYNP